MPNTFTKGKGLFGEIGASSGLLSGINIASAEVTNETVAYLSATSAINTNATIAFLSGASAIQTNATIAFLSGASAIVTNATVSYLSGTSAVVTNTTITSGVFSSGITVGGGANVTHLQFYSATITPPKTAVNTGVNAERTYTTGLTGLLNTDIALAFEPVTALASGLSIGGYRVSASGTLSVNWCCNALTSGNSSSGFADVYRLITIRTSGS